MATTDQSPTLIEPQKAWEMMQQNPSVLLLDVRSDMEFLMIGHPKGALHVAWIDEPDWTINPDFLPEVRKLMLGRLSARTQQTAPVILICRSSNRSVDAAKALLADGIEDVYVVDGGFEGPLDDDHHRNTVAGWRFANLPWEQC